MGNEILERMVGAETLEKIKWELQSGFGADEPEPGDEITEDNEDEEEDE